MNEVTHLKHMRTASYLIGCAIREDLVDMSLVGSVDTDELLDATDRHMLSAITSFSLQAAGINTPRVNEEVASGLWKAAQLEADWQQVRVALEEAGIWHCPVKGAVIKDLYPSLGMRQMADYDVLFDASRDNDVRSIMERLGFSCESFGRFHHDVYHKPPVTNFEMHRSLFNERANPTFAKYFETVKNRLIKDPDNGFGWHMSAEECYVYLLAHEYKHFVVGGTGLRSALDIYVFLRTYEASMDWENIRQMTRELEIEDFEQQQRAFAKHLFDGTHLSPNEEELFAYLATSGTYGTLTHYVKNRMAKEKDGALGKLHYLFRRVILPPDSVRDAYPFFYRHKVLLPALAIYRLGRAVSVRRKVVVRELGHVARYHGGAKAD